MPLTLGTSLGPYSVTAKIGEGGMGEVYRARDTKLDRDVALKVLPQAFTDDPDRLARFEREAKVLASLNHPNIGAIHGFEESGDTKALVLELIEGPTLADRIKQGAIPVDEALPIARQIAEALGAAHEQGIIHRDLKPANIKVKPDGTVKVLDFGLARALVPAKHAEGLDLQTVTAAPTATGVIIGTPAYMSPEQARGEPINTQTDIWAFGATLFEMLTTRRAFGDGNASETLARVLERPPDLGLLAWATPPAVRRLLGRCLAKDRRRRLADIRDVRLELEDMADEPASQIASQRETGSTRRFALALAVMVAFVAFVVVLLVGTARWPRPSGSATREAVTRFSIVPPRGYVAQVGGYQSVAISPSGQFVVFVGERGLHLRTMDSSELVTVRATEDIDALGAIVSPDDEWVAFYGVRTHQLFKVRLPDGPVVPVGSAESYFGGSWHQDGRIIFAQGSRGIFSVPQEGGAPEQLIEVDAEAGEIARNPQLLPGDDWMLFTLDKRSGSQGAQSNVVVQSLRTGDRRLLLEDGMDARYVASGHIVYGNADGNGELLASRFDLEQLTVVGSPTTIVEGLGRQTINQAFDFDISNTGSLVYRPAIGRTMELVWVDRSGNEEPLGAPARVYEYVRISPDGRQVAASILDQENDIWVWDLDRRTLGRLTFGPGRESYPTWTPAGQSVVFRGGSDRGTGLYARAADGTGDLEQLGPDSVNLLNPNSFSPDDQLVYREVTRGRENDLVLLQPESNQAAVLLAGPYNELNGEVSPDGRWLAYQSDESGVHEIYVRPFPDVHGGQWQVSSNGGMQPCWGPSGGELFYLTAESNLMRVSVESEAAPVLGRPELLVRRPGDSPPFPLGGRRYDVSPDGLRFLFTRQVEQADDPLAGLLRYDVVLNLTKELIERVPVN